MPYDYPSPQQGIVSPAPADGMYMQQQQYYHRQGHAYISAQNTSSLAGATNLRPLPFAADHGLSHTSAAIPQPLAAPPSRTNHTAFARDPRSSEASTASAHHRNPQSSYVPGLPHPTPSSSDVFTNPTPSRPAPYYSIPTSPASTPLYGQPVSPTASNSGTSQERYPCAYCDKTFSRNHDRKRHTETHVPGSAGNNRCPHCGKDYSRADSLKRHLDNGCDQVAR
ncbi:hypothetical protein BD410DRAFT_836737 [Rickenella mellea]|uniref:C2H2-type domain-containing protein n=1 Tax=Rickenella mellea TaxID=50990 RepID=A0A4Y7QG26_9AGAM|nr:hypothetical protein BD410DRAFT_836737 [Rickenella mellea]